MLSPPPLVAAKAKASYLENVGRPSKSCQKSDTIKIDTKKVLAKAAGVSLQPKLYLGYVSEVEHDIAKLRKRYPASAVLRR